MAQLALLTSLYAVLEQEVPGVSEQMMLQSLQLACRELTRRSESFVEQVIKIKAVEYLSDYTLTCPYSLNTQVERIMDVYVNSVRQCVPWYDLYRGTKLRFMDNYIPHDLDNRLLTCGTDGLAGVIGAWQAITDGSFTFTFDDSSTTDEATGIDCSGASDMYDVANIIQAAIRTAYDSNTGFVEWDEANNKFLFYCEAGELSYLTAGTTGTDISGAGYLNGLTGGTGVSISGLLEVNVAWRSDFTDSTTVPAWWLDRYEAGIIGWAMWNLASMNKTPWTSSTTAKKGKMAFNQALGEARRAEQDGNKNAINSIGA